MRVQRLPLLLATVVSLLSTPVVPSAAAADIQPGVWSCAAIAAAPTDDAVRNDLFDKLIGRVVFRPGRTGNAAFFCPVPHTFNMVITQLILTYQDGDGPSMIPGDTQGNNRVDATLKRVKWTTGNIGNVENILTVSSRNGPNSGPTGWTSVSSLDLAHPVRHQPDFAHYYYYIQINLIREDPAVPIGALGVGLFLTN